VVVYIDDILIFSKTAEEHVDHVHKILDLLRDNHYHIKLSKCEFEQKEVKFLGHMIGADGVKVDPAKVAVINGWKVSTNLDIECPLCKVLCGLNNLIHQSHFSHGSCAYQPRQEEHAVHLERILPESL